MRIRQDARCACLFVLGGFRLRLGRLRGRLHGLRRIGLGFGLGRFRDRVARGTRRSADTLLFRLGGRGGRRSILFGVGGCRSRILLGVGGCRSRICRFALLALCGATAFFGLRSGLLQQFDQLGFFIFAVGRNAVLLGKFVQLGDRFGLQFGLVHRIPPYMGFQMAETFVKFRNMLEMGHLIC